MACDSAVRVKVFREGERAHVRLVGPVDRETTDLFEKRLEGLLREGCQALTLDLGGADYVDSDGVRWLQQLQARLADRNGTLKLEVREGSRAQRTLHLLRLDSTLAVEVYPEESPRATRCRVGGT